jgi:hypothetical protein
VLVSTELDSNQSGGRIWKTAVMSNTTFGATTATDAVNNLLAPGSTSQGLLLDDLTDSPTSITGRSRICGCDGGIVIARRVLSTRIFAPRLRYATGTK